MASAQAPAADLFHVIREETAPFPGDWEPLRSKSVKIISVQKLDDAAKDAGPKEKLEYTKFLLDRSYTELAKKPQDLAGIVVIFDSADGGMIAATLPTLQQWRAGTLSDSALWHKCFFDPPETFEAHRNSGQPVAIRPPGKSDECVSLLRQSGLCFRLTFENEQSTYAVLGTAE